MSIPKRISIAFTAIVIYLATYLAIFNWYPFFESKPLAPHLLVSTPSAIRALATSLLLWNFVYVTSLYSLTTSMIRVATLRSVARVTLLGAIVAGASTALSLFMSYPYLATSSSEVAKAARSAVSMAIAAHLCDVSYVLNFFVIPAAVPIAVVYSIGGTRKIRELIELEALNLASVFIIAMLTHDFLEPLTNVATTIALLALGGPLAALPYYRGYDSLTLEYLGKALRNGWTLAPAPWGMIVGSLIFSIVVAKSIERLLLRASLYRVLRST